MPVTSMTWASLGTFTEEAEPTAAILPSCDYQHAVFDYAVRDREQLAAFEDNGCWFC